MNLRASCLAGIVAMVGLSPLAFARGGPGQSRLDEAAELVKRGEALGVGGEYQSALELFREAEAIQSRPVHNCWIAISYVKLEQWTRARLYLDRCKKRSNGKPEVDWFATADQQVRSKISDDFAAVTVNVDVEGAILTIPTVPGEELQLPVTVWLPIGQHELVVRHDDYPTRRQRLPLPTSDRTTVFIAIGDGTTKILKADPVSSSGGSSDGGEIDFTVPPETPQRPGKVIPIALITTGAVLAGVGFVFLKEALDAQDAVNRADDMGDPDARNEAAADIRSANTMQQIFFPAGALVSAAGIALLVRSIVWEPEEQQSLVNIGPTKDGGAAVWITGRF